MYWICIRTVDEKTKLPFFGALNVYCNTNWQQTAKEEFKNYKPGSKKEITVWQGLEKIYEFRNY